MKHLLRSSLILILLPLAACSKGGSSDTSSFEASLDTEIDATFSQILSVQKADKSFNETVSAYHAQSQAEFLQASVEGLTNGPVSFLGQSYSGLKDRLDSTNVASNLGADKFKSSLGVMLDSANIQRQVLSLAEFSKAVKSIKATLSGAQIDLDDHDKAAVLKVATFMMAAGMDTPSHSGNSLGLLGAATCALWNAAKTVCQKYAVPVAGAVGGVTGFAANCQSLAGGCPSGGSTTTTTTTTGPSSCTTSICNGLFTRTTNTGPTTTTTTTTVPPSRSTAAKSTTNK